MTPRNSARIFKSKIRGLRRLWAPPGWMVAEIVALEVLVDDWLLVVVVVAIENVVGPEPPGAVLYPEG
jgi:hypothetical protein